MVQGEPGCLNTDTRQDVHKPLSQLAQKNSQVTGTTSVTYIDYSTKKKNNMTHIQQN